jgi:D-lactate dehydrogenase (cytochrome)
MPIALFGHVGDGNFHLVILVDPQNRIRPAERTLNDRVVMRALAMGGTCDRRARNRHRQARLPRSRAR